MAEAVATNEKRMPSEPGPGAHGGVGSAAYPSTVSSSVTQAGA